MPGYIQIKELLRSAISDICFEMSKHRNEVPNSYLIPIAEKICPGIQDEELIVTTPNQNEIDIDSFASILLRKCGHANLKNLKEKGLPSQKQGFRLQEFITLLNTLYPFMEDRLSESRLRPIFKLIDTDNDGHITEEEVERLVVFVASSDRQKQHQNKGKLVFKSIETAKKIRNNLLKLLIKFDKNQDQKLNKEEVKSILTAILHDTDYELDYSLSIIYQNDLMKLISFEEMIDFLLEKHCGEMSIHRLQSMQKYKYEKKKSMDFTEFIQTLDNALGYFYDNIPETELEELFNLIDADQDGMIGYQEYLSFLKQYFGSQSQLSKCQMAQQNTHPKKNQAVKFLTEAFKEMSEAEESNYKNLFKLIVETSILTPKDHQKILTFLHMATTMLVRGHKTRYFKLWDQFVLSEEEFTDLIVDSTEWAELPMDASALKFIFSQLDSDSDHYISYSSYMKFIKQAVDNKSSQQLSEYLASLFVEEEENRPPATQVLKSAIWAHIKELYYQSLEEGEQGLKIEKVNTMISELLREEIEQIEYIRWNYSKIDKNNDLKISFQQFTTFLISHSAEVALQRFHMKQTNRKDSLNLEEFSAVTKDAFGYLQESQGWGQELRRVYESIREEETVSYKSYLNWIKKELA